MQEIPNTDSYSKLEKYRGEKLFGDFILRWPDFVEFDELN